MLSDIDLSGQYDREAWADVADLHECLARTIETNFAKAAHALDIRRLQNRKHLVTASVDDRLPGCRHGKRGLYITAGSHGAIRTRASPSETRRPFWLEVVTHVLGTICTHLSGLDI